MGVADLRSSMSNFSLYIFLIQKTKIEIGMRDGSVAKGRGDICGVGGSSAHPKCILKTKNQHFYLSLLLLLFLLFSLSLQTSIGRCTWAWPSSPPSASPLAPPSSAAPVAAYAPIRTTTWHVQVSRVPAPGTCLHLVPPPPPPAIAAIESLLTLSFYSYGCGLHARRCR